MRFYPIPMPGVKHGGDGRSIPARIVAEALRGRDAALGRSYGYVACRASLLLFFALPFGRMGVMQKRKPQKPLRQTTLDEFTGGDLLVGASAPGATITMC